MDAHAQPSTIDARGVTIEARRSDLRRATSSRGLAGSRDRRARSALLLPTSDDRAARTRSAARGATSASAALTSAARASVSGAQAAGIASQTKRGGSLDPTIDAQVAEIASQIKRGGSLDPTRAAQGTTRDAQGTASASRGVTSASRGVTSASRGVTSASQGVIDLRQFVPLAALFETNVCQSGICAIPQASRAALAESVDCLPTAALGFGVAGTTRALDRERSVAFRQPLSVCFDVGSGRRERLSSHLGHRSSCPGVSRRSSGVSRRSLSVSRRSSGVARRSLSVARRTERRSMASFGFPSRASGRPFPLDRQSRKSREVHDLPIEWHAAHDGTCAIEHVVTRSISWTSWAPIVSYWTDSVGRARV